MDRSPKGNSTYEGTPKYTGFLGSLLDLGKVFAGQVFEAALKDFLKKNKKISRYIDTEHCQVWSGAHFENSFQRTEGWKANPLRKEKVIVCVVLVGVKESYANHVRTILGPKSTKQMKAQYALAQQAYQHLLTQMEPGNGMHDVFNSTKNFILEQPGVKSHRGQKPQFNTFAVGIGVKYCITDLRVGKSNGILERGMTFGVNLFLKYTIGPQYAIAYGQTIILRPNAIATGIIDGYAEEDEENLSEPTPDEHPLVSNTQAETNNNLFAPTAENEISDQSDIEGNDEVTVKQEQSVVPFDQGVIKAEVESDFEEEVENEIEGEVESETESEVDREVARGVEDDVESDIEEEVQIEIKAEVESEIEGEVDRGVGDEVETENEGEVETEDEGEVPTEDECEVQTEDEGEGETEDECECEVQIEDEGGVESEGEGELKSSENDNTQVLNAGLGESKNDSMPVENDDNNFLPVVVDLPAAVLGKDVELDLACLKRLSRKSEEILEAVQILFRQADEIKDVQIAQRKMNEVKVLTSHLKKIDMRLQQPQKSASPAVKKMVEKIQKNVICIEGKTLRVNLKYADKIKFAAKKKQEKIDQEKKEARFRRPNRAAPRTTKTAVAGTSKTKPKPNK